MSRYGINFYGPGTFYGETPLIEFDARPMAAYSREYGQMTVSWRTPSGAWDRLRLTRDPAGFAPRADMGTLLLDSPKAGAPTTYDDLSGLSEGKFYYYTVWVRATADQQWRRAGDVIALVTQDWGYGRRMYELIPGAYRDRDMDTPSYRLYGRGDLDRFLDIPGFEADHIRSEYETLKWVNDPDKVSGGLLPLMAKQLGFGYEGELGMRLARQQMKNAVYIYKHKGTQLGTEALASVLTGWAPTVTVGHNLALDQNDSSFEEGTGQWANVSNATLGRRSTSDASAPGAITGPVEPPPGASTGDIGSGTWMLMLSAIGAGDMVIQGFADGTAYDNRTKSIPVKAGSTYIFSVYSYALDVVRSVRLGVEWFDINGNSLGAVTEGPTLANLTNAWTRHTYATVAPATAAFARATIRALSAATGNRILFDAFQAEAVVSVLTANEASIETDATGWGGGMSNMTIAKTTDQSLDGTASLQMTSVAAGTMVTKTIQTTRIVGAPGEIWTATAYFRSATVARNALVAINWRNAAGGFVASSMSPQITTTTTGWTVATVTAVAPAGTERLNVEVQVLNTGAAGEVHYLDSVSLVKTGLYQSARSIRIAFNADRVNLVSNAGFEVNLTGWTELDSVASMTPTRDTTRFHDGTASLKMANTATGQDDYMEATVPAARLQPSTQYTVSAWLYVESITGTANTSRGLFVYDTALGGVGSKQSLVPLTHAVGVWVRHSVVFVTPATPANMGIRLYAPQGTVYWDSVLAERGSTLLDYFDGTTQTNEGEYMWESGGTPGNTPSYYYSRRLIKNYRLNVRMVEFLPAGSTYALLYAGAT